eukprot:gene6658-13477_t
MLRKVQLSNFKNYGQFQSIDIGDANECPFTVVIGRNGSGKSSLIDAIEWCCFGSSKRYSSIRVKNVKELINSSSKLPQMWVEVEFLNIKNGEIFRIKRGYKSGSMVCKAWLSTSKDDFNEVHPSDTNDILLSFGIDLNNIDRVLIKQNSTSIATSTPICLLNFIENSIGTNILESTRIKIKDFKSDIKEQENQSRILKIEKEQKDIEKSSNMSTLRNSIEHRKKLLEENRTVLESIHKHNENIQNSIQKLKTDVQQVELQAQRLYLEQMQIQMKKQDHVQVQVNMSSKNTSTSTSTSNRDTLAYLTSTKRKQSSTTITSTTSTTSTTVHNMNTVSLDGFRFFADGEVRSTSTSSTNRRSHTTNNNTGGGVMGGAAGGEVGGMLLWPTVCVDSGSDGNGVIGTVSMSVSEGKRRNGGSNRNNSTNITTTATASTLDDYKRSLRENEKELVQFIENISAINNTITTLEERKLQLEVSIEQHMSSKQPIASSNVNIDRKKLQQDIERFQSIEDSRVVAERLLVEAIDEMRGVCGVQSSSSLSSSLSSSVTAHSSTSDSCDSICKIVEDKQMLWKNIQNLESKKRLMIQELKLVTSNIKKLLKTKERNLSQISDQNQNISQLETNLVIKCNYCTMILEDALEHERIQLEVQLEMNSAKIQYDKLKTTIRRAENEFKTLDVKLEESRRLSTATEEKKKQTILSLKDAEQSAFTLMQTIADRTEIGIGMEEGIEEVEAVLMDNNGSGNGSGSEYELQSNTDNGTVSMSTGSERKRRSKRGQETSSTSTTSNKKIKKESSPTTIPSYIKSNNSSNNSNSNRVRSKGKHKHLAVIQEMELEMDSVGLEVLHETLRRELSDINHRWISIDFNLLQVYENNHNQINHLNASIHEKKTCASNIQIQANVLQESRFDQLSTALRDLNHHIGRMYQSLIPFGNCYLSFPSVSVSLFEEGVSLLVQHGSQPWKETGKLSGGQQAVCGLAESFPSQLYIMDEVDAALDSRTAARLGQLLREKARSTGAHFVVVSHRPELHISASRLVGLYLREGFPCSVSHLFPSRNLL